MCFSWGQQWDFIQGCRLWNSNIGGVYHLKRALNQHKFSAGMWSLVVVTSYICNHKIHLFSSIDQMRQLRDSLPRYFSSSLQVELLELLRIKSTEQPSAANTYQKARMAKDRAQAANTAHEESNKIYYKNS